MRVSKKLSLQVQYRKCFSYHPMRCDRQPLTYHQEVIEGERKSMMSLVAVKDRYATLL